MKLPAKIICMCILTMGACGAIGPDDRGIEVIDDLEVHDQSKAMFLTQRMVEGEYEDLNFGDLHNTATIYWSDTTCPTDPAGRYAVFYEDYCYHGRTFSCDEIYVALSNKDSNYTCGSSLLHEFGHCLHMKSGGGGDSGHMDERFWEVIQESQNTACERGW